jgi:hypothetical protein
MVACRQTVLDLSVDCTMPSILMKPALGFNFKTDHHNGRIWAETKSQQQCKFPFHARQAEASISELSHTQGRSHPNILGV